MDPNTLPQLYEDFSRGERAHLPVNADGARAQPLAGARVNGGGEIHVREATIDDMPFIDQLQKMHTHMVGWMARKALESYIEGGWVLVAESEGHAGEATAPLGYCIYKDEYKKREDVGIIYQLNVLPIQQRKLIGATLVQAAFARAAYGCKLFCCWCAQDIAANFFWESVGFVPLAFRTGSRDKQRIHIFWQRRIRADDTETEYWYPYRTDAGSVREDRIVLPIPPGTHWRDAKPVIVPELPVLPAGEEEADEQDDTPKLLPGGQPVRPRPRPTNIAELREQAPLRKAVVSGGRVKHVEAPVREPESTADDCAVSAKPRRKSRPRAKHSAEHVKLAREVRDRYLEEVNIEGCALPPGACGRWDVSRGIEDAAARHDGDDDVRYLDAA